MSNRFVILMMAWTTMLMISLSTTQGANFRFTHVTGDISVLSEFDVRGLTAELNNLSTLRDEIYTTLKLQPVDNALPITVYLFQSKWSYRSYLAQRVPEAVNRPACFVQGTDMLRLYAFQSSSLSVELRNEMTHAFLHQVLAFVPLWLDEGLAEYFEVPTADRYARHPHLRQIKMTPGLLWRPDLHSLANQNTLSKMGGNEYRDAWAWVHFMIHGPPQAQSILCDYLATIQKHDVPQPLQNSLPAQFGDSGEALRRHVNSIR